MYAQLHHSVWQLPLFPVAAVLRDDNASIYLSQQDRPSEPQIMSAPVSVPKKSVQTRASSRFRYARITDFCMATDMMRLGYHYTVVAEQTRLSMKQAKSLWEKLKSEGLLLPSCSLKLRHPTAVKITNRTAKIHVSIMMQAYRRLGGHGIMQAIDICSLNTAWGCYQQTFNQPNIVLDHDEMLTINQAWGLARMLKENQACFEYCSYCQSWFFTCIEEQTTLSCPFCRT